MTLAGEVIMNVPCNIERGRLSQGRIGGTKYDFSNPTIVVSQVLFSIQSAKPADIETWGKRGASVSHKGYTVDSLAAASAQGDRIADTRFNPPRYYIVEAPPEDMAGQGLMWGFFLRFVP